MIQNLGIVPCPKCCFPLPLMPNELDFWMCPRCKYSFGHKERRLPEENKENNSSKVKNKKKALNQRKSHTKMGVWGEMMKPNVVCLCGSTRFTAEMLIIQWELTKEGNIVLGWCALPDSYFDGEDRTHGAEQEGVKEIVDEVHRRKIDLADWVYVLNIDGYIGESTRSEIEYAEAIGKPVRYLEGQEK